jgi:uncharacterized protein (DUF2249 family)
MSTGDETTDGTAGTGPDRTLDVRRVEEPFDRIVEALETLPAGGTLTLNNSLEPEPLYGVLEARGFEHEARQAGPEEWRVEIAHA